MKEARSPRLGEPLLALQGIEKRWPRTSAPVLAGVDLELAPGTRAFVGGSNGAGKTTLLRIAAGMFAADSGTVRLDGLDPARDRRAYQSRVGFLAAGTSSLYARLSVAAHLRLWSRLALLPRRQAERAINAVAECFCLDELIDRRVDRLSMGQRQRVRLAMAFLHQPDVVLLDEPLTSLDGEGERLLLDALDDLTLRGGAAVWCAPSPGDASFDDIYWLERGELTRG